MAVTARRSRTFVRAQANGPIEHHRVRSLLGFRRRQLWVDRFRPALGQPQVRSGRQHRVRQRVRL